MAASTNLTPEQRALRARIAANARWSRDRDRKGQARRGQAGLLARFEAQVDPDGTLPAAERRRLAENARAEHMARLSFLASKARARKPAA